MEGVALKCFSSNTRYLLDVLDAANEKLRKRVGVELEAAEREARRDCKQAGTKVCFAVSACGTGDCPFAKQFKGESYKVRGSGTFRPAWLDTALVQEYDLSVLEDVIVSEGFGKANRRREGG